jgi:acyl carrier protein
MSSLREQVAAFTKTIFAGFLEGDAESDIDEETVIGEGGLGVESIGILEVVVHLEQEFDISIPDDVVKRMASSTFGALVDEVVGLIPASADSEGAVR